MKRSTFTSEASYTEVEVVLWSIEVAESIGHNSYDTGIRFTRGNLLMPK